MKSAASERVVKFIERIGSHARGVWAGKPFLLPQFQKQITHQIFGPQTPEGTRVVSTAYLEIPKKNGKSEYAAILGLFGLLGDNEPGSEVYIAAAARHQAGRIFETCSQMVRNNKFLRSRLEIHKTTKTITVKDHPLSFLRAISADAGLNDGVEPSMVIFDEIHRQKDRSLWSILEYGMVNRQQGLMIGLTTAGIESESPLAWELHEYAEQLQKGVFKDQSFVGIHYGLKKEDNWKDKRNWVKCNPAMKGPLAFKRVDAMAKSFNQAQRIPSRENEFRRYHLNQWVTSTERWIPLEEWDKPTMAAPFNTYDLEGMQCFGGLDLSTNKDVTALSLLFPIQEQIFWLPKFWIPKEGIHERAKRDRVPWDRWADAGLVTLCEGNTINHDQIRADVNAMGRLYSIRELAYDPWNAIQLGQQLQDDGFQMVTFRPSRTTYNVPCTALERNVFHGRIRHGANPILRWMVDCTSIKRDTFDRIAPVKPDRDKSSKRIDGVVAGIMAHDRLERHHPMDVSAFLADPIIIG